MTGIGESTLLAEEQVLGSILLDPDVFAGLAGKVKETHFSLPQHQRLFRACESAFSDGDAIQPDTIIARMGDSEGAADLVLDIRGKVGSVADVQHYADQVLQQAQRRHLQRQFGDMAIAAADPAAKPGDLVDAFQAQLTSFNDQGAWDTLQPITSTLPGALQELDARRKNGGGICGLATGVRCLDRNQCGWRPGDLIVLAAPPANCKSALALQISDYVASMDKKVLVYSMEMPAAALVERLLARRSGVNASRLRSGVLEPSHIVALEAAANDLANDTGENLLVDDRGGITTGRIMADLQRESVRGGADLVVVDHLQLIVPEKSKGTRNDEVASICGALKQMALRFQVPVLALSQLNRQGSESRGKFHLGHLRDSGAIGQDADVVMFMRLDDDGEVKLDIGKNRYGPVGEVGPITFDPFLQKFSG